MIRNQKLILVFTLVVWLANYMVCFCCEDPNCHNQFLEGSVGSSGEHSDQDSDDSPVGPPIGCNCSCGLQMFTPIEDKSSVNEDLPSHDLHLSCSIFVEQISLNSIFHPPEA